MTRDPIYDEMKRHSKEKFNRDRKAFLARSCEKDDGEWTKHTEFHWSRTLDGQRLDYWPSRNKFQYKGRVKRGDVFEYVKRAEKRAAKRLATREISD